jgi:four helix bundle protein
VKNILKEKSYKFALRVVSLCRYLNEEKREFILSKQILTTGTSIGAYVEEAWQGENRADFLSKLSTANKFAFKTNYWLRILRDSRYLNDSQAESLLADCDELQSLLVASIKTTRKSLQE